jgi:hypothetical protein
MRDKLPAGLDDMGNTALGGIVGGTPTVAASGGGAETALVAKANLPSYNLDVTGLSIGTTITNSTTVIRGAAGASTQSGSGVNRLSGGTSDTLSLASGAIIGTLPLGGSGTAINKMPPYTLGSFYIRL